MTAEKKPTEPNATMLTVGVATVELDGKLWPIPRLGIRQLKIVHGKVGPLLKALVTEELPIEDLTAEQFDSVCDIVYAGLSRAHPMLTRDEFDEFSCDRIALITAMLKVARLVYGDQANTSVSFWSVADAAQPAA